MLELKKKIKNNTSTNSNIKTSLKHADMIARQTLDSKIFHRTGMARSEGRGQCQRNKLRLAGELSLESFQSKGSDQIYEKNERLALVAQVILPPPTPLSIGGRRGGMAPPLVQKGGVILSFGPTFCVLNMSKGEACLSQSNKLYFTRSDRAIQKKSFVV